MNVNIQTRHEEKVLIHLSLSDSEKKLMDEGMAVFGYTSRSEFVNAVLEDAALNNRIVPEVDSDSPAAYEPKKYDVLIRIPQSAFEYILDVLKIAYPLNRNKSVPSYIQDTVIHTMILATEPERQARLKREKQEVLNARD